jgi:hypothetical protein
VHSRNRSFGGPTFSRLELVVVVLLPDGPTGDSGRDDTPLVVDFDDR